MQQDRKRTNLPSTHLKFRVVVSRRLFIKMTTKITDPRLKTAMLRIVHGEAENN